MRRLIPGIVVACLLTFTAAAFGFPPFTVTDSTQDSVTLRGLDCGTQYRIRVDRRNATDTGWIDTTTQTTSTAACSGAATTADFTVSPEPAVRNQPTRFTSTGPCAATPCTYQWLHGDASSTEQIGTGPSVSFTYTGTPGPRTVTLEVTDGQSRTVTSTQTFQLVDSAATPTPTSTPTASPTPTATSTPTPTSTPSASGFPDASNTGVPAGTQLTPYTGPTTISTPNTVIDAKHLSGNFLIDAPGVVIKNSMINGSLQVNDNTSNSLLLEDSELDCNPDWNTGIGEANVTVRRANIHGCENGMDMNQNMDIRDSYIHGLDMVGHADGIQLAAHYENGQVVDGAKNITIVHNTIFSHTDTVTSNPDDFGTSAIISNHGGDTNVLIQNNLMAGGAYTLYCDQNASGANYRVLDNHFTTRFKPSVGYFGSSVECSDETQSGNVIDETGQPIHLD